MGFELLAGNIADSFGSAAADLLSMQTSVLGQTVAFGVAQGVANGPKPGEDGVDQFMKFGVKSIFSGLFGMGLGGLSGLFGGAVAGNAFPAMAAPSTAAAAFSAPAPSLARLGLPGGFQN